MNIKNLRKGNFFIFKIQMLKVPCGIKNSLIFCMFRYFKIKIAFLYFIQKETFILYKRLNTE
jgi:hypothetical protein